MESRMEERTVHVLGQTIQKITEAEKLKLPRVTLSERKYMCFPLEDLEDSRN